jgi:hypothetical protein
VIANSPARIYWRTLATVASPYDRIRKDARACGPNTMTGFTGLERVHRGVETALVAPPPLEPNRTARGTTTTDGPLEMQTPSTIHTDSLVAGVFPKPVRVEVDSADPERLTETATVTGTTEPAPPAEVLAERARRALEEAWAADWGSPWMKAIWTRRPRSGGRHARRTSDDRLAQLDRVR